LEEKVVYGRNYKKCKAYEIDFVTTITPSETHTYEQWSRHSVMCMKDNFLGHKHKREDKSIHIIECIYQLPLTIPPYHKK
jgi:hypothetical protein